jgi:putative PIN family toxin of toxin-antitoxin system
MSTVGDIGIVADTNIVVSANLKPAGAEAIVLRLALNRRLQLYVSEEILAEYERVLYRPRFRFVAAEIDRLLFRLRKASIWVTPGEAVTASPDSADNRFLECAVGAEADFLVTGNRRHFPKRWGRTEIVSARELMIRLGPILFPPLTE